jgi:hypothetical protein
VFGTPWLLGLVVAGLMALGLALVPVVTPLSVSMLVLLE